MEPIYLYNQNFFWLGKAKKLIKKFLGKDFGGPQSVFDSLTLGLNELGIPYKINASLPKVPSVVCVLSGVDTLLWAIQLKQQGKIRKIIAGPNLVVGSEDYGGIIKNPLIDIFIAPSQWVKDFYHKAVPQMREKIRIWPAGVNLPALQETEKIYDFLVYNKIKDGKLSQDILNFLNSQNFKCTVLSYGDFKQQDYFKMLSKSKYLIYLSESESQGLAMFEAWARGIPTLVWERGFWQTDKYFWQGLTSSPYIAPENGMRFKDFEEFKKVLPQFLSTGFSSYEFTRINFSNKVCAQKYLEIVNNA